MRTFARVESPERLSKIWGLLAHAVGPCDAAKRRRIEAQYLQDARCALYTLDEGDGTVALVGCRLGPQCEAEILHLSVAPARRREGIGREALLRLFAELPIVRVWEAETDDEAVGFYRTVGFAVESLGELYPGVKRYRCTLPRGE